MKDNILLLDPSIASSNVGDEIIMECVMKELQPILRDRFVFRLPTHVSPFHWYQVWRNSFAVQKYASCAFKFACGSNLLIKDMLTHYPQWNINVFNSRPLRNTILVGVGASSHDYTNKYTTSLYKKVLSHDYAHSVRDERTKKYVESLGLRAINTGCATMWMLTPEFCRSIPTKKASRVVCTLTANSTRLPSDQCLIDTLKKNYNEVYIWIQGDKDRAYFSGFNNIDGVGLLPPSKAAYEALLNEPDIDYVGTRLHAGVYAMRHAKRSIIIVIDERAREINNSNNLVCIERDRVHYDLDEMINSDFATEITMPLERISEWKAQFGY